LFQNNNIKIRIFLNIQPKNIYFNHSVVSMISDN